MACYNPNDLSPDELSCPICFEEFAIHSSSERSPKLLLCLHTFCLGCIRNLVKSNKTIQCSICRTEHKDVSPLELFDNYVIVDFIKKQQEESDALLARQHSFAEGGPVFMTGSNFDDYEQKRLHQVESDAAYARRIQSLYDEDGNVEPEEIERAKMSMDYSAPATCREAVREKTAPPTTTHSMPTFSCGHISNPPQPATATTSQATVYGHSSSMPSRSVTPDTSASSSTTPSSSTTSSNGTSTTTSSDSTSSDDRCSSQASGRLDDEFVDSVDIIDPENDRIASEVAGVGQVNISGSTGISVLTATHTNNSGFSSSSRLEDEDANGDDENDDDDDGVISEGFLSELDEDGGEDSACVIVEPADESDVGNMEVLETLDVNTVDDDSQEQIDVDEDASHQLSEDSNWGGVVQQSEDELFNNFNILESRNVEDIDTSAAPMSSGSGSSESEDSCADVPPVVDIADEEVSLDSVLAGVNDPDDDTASTVTLNDTVESESDNIVLLNEYNGVLTRSATSKLRKSNPNLSV